MRKRVQVNKTRRQSGRTYSGAAVGKLLDIGELVDSERKQVG